MQPGQVYHYCLVNRTAGDAEAQALKRKTQAAEDRQARADQPRWFAERVGLKSGEGKCDSASWYMVVI